MTTATAEPRTTDGAIYHPLDALRGTIRRFVLLDGLLVAGLFLVGWFWLGLALDFGLFKLTGFDWVQDAPRGLRAAALGVLLLVLVAIVVRRVALRVRREFSYPSLALVLEKRFPAVLGDRLITAVELADVAAQARYGYSADMIRRTITEAREKVAQVPVGTVFNWRRMWVKAVMLAVITAGTLVAAFTVYSGVTQSVDPAGFAWRFGDVAGIWGERNLLLKNTPWPRRAHLELVEFPPSGDLRIGKDAGPPKVRVRAVKWVVADATSRDGWRPMTWDDAKTFLFFDSVGGWVAEFDSHATVDSLEPVLSQREDGRFAMRLLDGKAESPSMSRTLRKLVVPEDVTLTYTGPKTGGTVGLSREPNGDFTGDVTGLKESVRFVVKGEDFATAPARITLVPPPMLLKLSRTEYEPACFYHPAPADLTDESLSNLPQAYAALKGLRQAFAEKALTLTGDKSVCSVIAGTEVVITGAADKPLRDVFLTPKQGRIPGAAAGSNQPVRVQPTGDSFTIEFRGEDRVRQTAEFELTLVDGDGVKSARSILIQATDDPAPQVEVAVDVLRKQGNAYLCTPVALVPFLADSVIRNGTGLSGVGFEFGTIRQETAAVAGFQAQVAAGVVGVGLPLGADLGPAVAAAAAATANGPLLKGEKRVAGNAPVSRFNAEYLRLPRDTLAGLKAKLGTPADKDKNPPAVVRQVKGLDPFDVEAFVPAVRAGDSAEVPPRFRLELNVVALDVNVEAGPKRGQNVEPIRLLVISEQDLLAEISKDEEGQIGRFDDVLRKLRDALGKFNQTADRLAGAAPPKDILVAAQVRALDVLQDVGKGREGTQALVVEYGRLFREVETNRVGVESDPETGGRNSKVGRRYDREVIRPLGAVLAAAGEFRAAEDALTAYQAPLLAERKPDDAATAAARAALTALINKLQEIRQKQGDAQDFAAVLEELKTVRDRQLQVSKVLAERDKFLKERLFKPTLTPPAPVALAKGEKKVVKQGVEWNLFDGSFQVRVEVPVGGELAGPPAVTVKDDRDDFEYELTAGATPGEYAVRLVPSVGEAVTVKVTVK